MPRPSTFVQRLALLTFLVSACGVERNHFTGPDSTGVTGVFVTPDSVMLDPAQSYQFTAFGRNRAGDTLGVNAGWSASAGSITSTGLYTADTTDNDALVTATIPMNGVTLSASSAVKKRRVIEILLTPATASMSANTTQQFTARGVRNAGDTVSVSVTYTATGGAINGNGLYTAGSVPGSFRVIATYNRRNLADTALVTVTQVPVASVTVSPASATVAAGATAQLTATTLDAFGNVVTGRIITWSSGANGVATVSASGLVTAVAPGTASIVATSEGMSDTAAITVTTVPVASLTLAPAAATITAGATVQLSATTRDAGGNILTGRAITWTSSATGIATVSANGLVTGVSAGTANVIATSEGKSDTAAITVTAVPVASLTITPASANLRVGGTVQLSATTRDAGGNILTGRAITWTSSSTGVATVSANGLVTGVAAGSANIIATSEGKSDTAAVTVTVVPVASLVLTPATATITIGATVQLSAVTKDSAGGVLTGRTTTWTSTATGVATVSANGLVSGVAVGTAQVIATSEGKSDTSSITVQQTGGTLSGLYVSPTGTSSGDGSVTRPWDLQTALSGAGGRIQPGDTVWLRGGTYVGHFTSTLSGTASAPIVVREYPGERATLDRNGLTGEPLVVDGSWTIYWGFEVMNSATARFGSGLAVRPAGVYVRNASNVKLINLLVHDTGHGTYVENTAHNIEIYGWIIFNGGSDNSSRGDGHGIYIRNDGTTRKLVRDNVIFDQYGFGLHGYAEGGDHLDHMVFEGNVVFNNGTLSAFPSPNMILGGVTSATNDTIRANLMYFGPGLGPRNIRIGYDVSVNGTALFDGNYVVGGSQVLDVTYWQNLTVRNNTLIGTSRVLALADASSAGYTWSGNQHYRDPAATAWREVTTDYTFNGWKQATGLGGSDVAASGTPTQTQIFVRPNMYEPGRGNVVVYNWSGQSAVSVDLSNVLRVGDTYEIRNVQALFGAPLVSGVYSGGAVSIPMAAVTPAPPIGGSPNAPRPTGPDFGVFLVTSGAASVAFR